MNDEENVCVCATRIRESVHQSLMEHENSEKERNGNVDGGGGEENWCACSRAEIQTKHDGLI